MATLNSRGHEVVSSVPFEPAVRLGRPPRETLEDRLRRMVMIRTMQENDAIKDEADYLEDLNDFSDDPADPNLIEPSRYEVPDDVSDHFSAAEYRDEQAQKKNSPKPEDSGTESSGLAGE